MARTKTAPENKNASSSHTELDNPDKAAVPSTSSDGKKEPKGFVAWLFKVKKFLRLDKHHRIERFGVMSSAFGISFLLIVIPAFYYSTIATDALNNARSLYTSTFATSKSGSTGEVTGLYTNKSKTHAMLMMKFDDSADMSAVASNYQAFIAGTDIHQGYHSLKSKPKGSIYVFGSTGYMGLYLTSSTPFPSQILSLTMRANAQLVSPEDSNASISDDAELGKSFTQYDQWRVFFNPGATKQHTISALNSKNADIYKLYAQTVIKPQEEKIRKTLNSDLVTMKADLAAIKDYTTRLTTTSLNGLHVKTPKPLAVIAGDEVLGSDTNGKSTLRLKSKVVIANGFNFDWRDGSVEKGYLDSVVPPGKNYLTWLSSHQQKTPQSINVSDYDWKMTDGSSLSDQASSDLTPVQQINSNISLLTQGYQTYLTDKTTYESQDLMTLLGLEVSLRDVAENNTVNHAPKAVNLY